MKKKAQVECKDENGVRIMHVQGQTKTFLCLLMLFFHLLYHIKVDTAFMY